MNEEHSERPRCVRSRDFKRAPGLALRLGGGEEEGLVLLTHENHYVPQGNTLHER